MVKIIVKQAFPLFLPLLNETIVFSRKNNNITLCIKAFINMVDKCSLNLDKNHLYEIFSVAVHSI